jgi:hypothetical protein
MTKLLKSLWFNRFRIYENEEHYVFKDILNLSQRKLEKKEFDGLTGDNLNISFFEKGFLDPCIEPYPNIISYHITDLNNYLFWQFPCKTEANSFEKHKKMKRPRLESGVLDVYIGLPWATFIDAEMYDNLAINSIKTRLTGFKQTLKDLGVTLKVHTVCQHVYWHKFIDIWNAIGVTDLWLSHCPKKNVYKIGALNLHPWSLFAVNVEDPNRNIGLLFGKKPTEKKYLASFIGAHYEHYISNVRLQLFQFSDLNDFYIKVSDKWHFHDVVYLHQMKGLPLEDTYRIDDEVYNYNNVLSDSVFALCPSGAGPNSLRLWEALAVGSIPVILGEPPLMPRGGSLHEIDWDKIIITIDENDISNLPTILRSFSMEEIIIRQDLAMNAYQLVKNQRCF